MTRLFSVWCRIGCAAIALVACSLSASVRADGALVMGKRELFRVGPAAKHYCEIPSAECDTVLTKFLSGYSFLRGSVRAGLSLTPPERVRGLAGFGAFHLDAAAAALPGGDMAVGSVDAVLARDQMLKLRVTLADLESVFVCHDEQSGRLALPFVGMVTRQCSGDAWLGVDVRVLRLQWDAAGNVAEWMSAAPAFELLRNGLGQAHLLRSLVVAVPVDLQSRMSGSAPHGTSFGVGLRLSALYRTPQWESRLRVRHRTALASGEGFARVHSFDAELRLLRNWFAHDALVMQTGLAFSMDWASHTWAGQSLWTSRYDRLGFQASLYIGWVNAPPAI